ncbi:hypothetical protein A2Y47_00640 [Candidatus Giovannonibacteria bacterium RIFCSPLOWO2_12_43_8]|uniref:Uncharacterized protein n=1 Tax=Candidatus Giovannonibacteria bacterium RIFCSPLOWO2_12_43_8 TaxID=1798361 RepID=A0A1F5Y4N7_9BACT|nr:MAG: hypothetical protein A2Y47_00640 [Candidatus Giovannonibacteria bacterium RIFCSPLOWO2_12_43_8]
MKETPELLKENTPVQQIATDLETAGVHVTEEQKKLVEEITDEHGGVTFDDWLKKAKNENLPRDLLIYYGERAVERYILRENWQSKGNLLQEISKIRDGISLPENELQKLVKGTVLKMLNQVESPGKISVTIDALLDPKKDPEIESAIKHNLAFRLREHGEDDIKVSLDRFLPLLPENSLSDPKIIEAAKDGIKKQLREGRIYETKNLLKSKEFPVISEEWMKQAADEEMLRSLERGNISNTSMIHGEFFRGNNWPEFRDRPDVNKAAEKGLIAALRKSASDDDRSNSNRDAVSITEGFKFSDEFVSNPVIQELGNSTLLKSLWRGESGISDRLKYRLRLSPPPKEIQNAAREGVLFVLNSKWFYSQLSGRETINRVNEIVNIKEKFSSPDAFLNDKEIKKGVEETFLKLLTEGIRGDDEGMKKLEENFPLDSSFLQGDSVREAAEEGVQKALENGSIYWALDIVTRFSVSPDILENSAKDIASKFIALDSMAELKRLKQAIPSFGEKELREAANRAFEGTLRGNYGQGFSSARRIAEQFHFEKDFINELVKKSIFEAIEKRRFSIALEMQEEFALHVSSEELLKTFPALKGFLDRFKDVSEEFYAQAQKSPDVLFSVFPLLDSQDDIFKVVRENPFLLEAVAQNPRFGAKLLLKFQQFDAPSKENISFLFESKEEVLKISPSIKLDTAGFRTAMQQRLIEWKQNPDILRAIQEAGIDSNEWLNYHKEDDFFLEAENQTRFSESVATPLFRIQETLEAYGNNIKEALGEYQKEFSGGAVFVEDPTKIDEQIHQLEQERHSAQEGGNQKKAEGIAKGIESLQRKKDKLKKISVWDKLMGDIDGFLHLRAELDRTHTSLIAAEHEFEEEISKKSADPDRILKSKRAVSTEKEKIKQEFAVLGRRIEDFEKNFLPTISPVLGEERGEAVIQEIQNGMEEGLSHYRTDRNTLLNLFSEKADKDKEALEGRPMKISVWSRNPDIDLYQANYSPCCISIERGYYADGGESTIADYNTDLGIQIVQIWDKAKGEPVTAAWCWLGEDDKGENVLVVDNIESNTLYSTNFTNQLTLKLQGYIKEYARDVGVEKVVLGQKNNDLPSSDFLAGLQSSSGTYKKIGGYNRVGGYYLEAEDNPTKIL